MINSTFIRPIDSVLNNIERNFYYQIKEKLDFSYDLQIAINAVLQVGEVIAENFYKPKVIKLKNDNSFLTNVDLLAEKVLINFLLHNTNYAINSEEHGIFRNKSKFKWHIDPIDGTTNYVHGNELFSTSICLTHNRDIILGVVYNPVRKELFFAETNSGTYKNFHLCNFNDKIHNEQKRQTIYIDHGYDIDSKQKISILKRELGKYFNLVELSSTALSLCYLLDYEADGFISIGDKIWDYGAGAIIAKEAGGIVDIWDNIILASSKILFDFLKELIIKTI